MDGMVCDVAPPPSSIEGVGGFPSPPEETGSWAHLLVEEDITAPE